MALTLAEEVLLYHRKAAANPKEYMISDPLAMRRVSHYKKSTLRTKLDRGLAEHHVHLDTPVWLL